MIQDLGRDMARGFAAMLALAVIVGALAATILIFLGPWALRGLRWLLNALPL